MAHFFKVLVIGMLLKNNQTAAFGDIVDGDRFTDNTDKLIDEGFIEKSNKRKESKAGEADDDQDEETDFEKNQKAAVNAGLDNLANEAAVVKETPVTTVKTTENEPEVVEPVEETAVTKVKTTAPAEKPADEPKGPDATKILGKK